MTWALYAIAALVCVAGAFAVAAVVGSAAMLVVGNADGLKKKRRPV